MAYESSGHAIMTGVMQVEYVHEWNCRRAARAYSSEVQAFTVVLTPSAEPA